MPRSELSRRDFQRLTAASIGGLLVGANLRSATAQEKKKDKENEKKNPLLEEPHACRGLNTCKMKDKTKKNDCAGMGACFSAGKHECKGQNACRGQGGCGEHPGENQCKEMGECAVPLKDETWKKARKRFEELMKKEGKKVGPAPPKKS